MNTYFYAAVQCRDVRAFQEVRTVGAVMFAPEVRFGELRCVPLSQKLGKGDHLFVAQLLDAWQREVAQVAVGGQATALAWLTEHAVGREDLVRLAVPAVGMADDPKKELGRLVRELTGYSPRNNTTSTEKVINTVLRSHGLHKWFQPGKLSTGLAEWRFDYVSGGLVIHPLDFTQSRPEGVLDAAFREVGRFDELRRTNASLDILAVSPRAGSPVIERALDVYREHRIDVVDATPEAVENGLRAHGLFSDLVNK